MTTIEQLKVLCAQLTPADVSAAQACFERHLTHAAEVTGGAVPSRFQLWLQAFAELPAWEKFTWLSPELQGISLDILRASQQRLEQSLELIGGGR